MSLRVFVEVFSYNSAWFPCVESLSEAVGFEFEITCPKEYTAVASGELMNRETFFADDCAEQNSNSESSKDPATVCKSEFDSKDRKSEESNSDSKQSSDDVSSEPPAKRRKLSRNSSPGSSKEMPNSEADEKSLSNGINGIHLPSASSSDNARDDSNAASDKSSGNSSSGDSNQNSSESSDKAKLSEKDKERTSSSQSNEKGKVSENGHERTSSSESDQKGKVSEKDTNRTKADATTSEGKDEPVKSSEDLKSDPIQSNGSTSNSLTNADSSDGKESGIKAMEDDELLAGSTDADSKDGEPHSRGDSAEDKVGVEYLVSCGFKRERCVYALAESNGSTQEALSLLSKLHDKKKRKRALLIQCVTVLRFSFDVACAYDVV